MWIISLGTLIGFVLGVWIAPGLLGKSVVGSRAERNRIECPQISLFIFPARFPIPSALLWVMCELFLQLLFTQLSFRWGRITRQGRPSFSAWFGGHDLGFLACFSLLVSIEALVKPGFAREAAQPRVQSMRSPSWTASCLCDLRQVTVFLCFAASSAKGGSGWWKPSTS